MFHSSGLYAFLMFIAGIGIPVMAALNGGLSSRLESPALATAILFLVGGIVSLGFFLLSEGMPKSRIIGAAPPYFYLGGIFVAFYILSISWVAPKFGVGNAVAFVLLGQLVSMALIDHLGLLGAPQHGLSIQRLAGLALMAMGVFLAVR